MEIMLTNKNGFQVNISLSIFFIAFCDLFTDFPRSSACQEISRLPFLETEVS
jgi:hypothetical protein